MGAADGFVDGQRANAWIAWALVASLLLLAGQNVLVDEFLWAGFATVAAGLATLPAVLTRDPSVTVAWPLVALVAAGLAVRSAGYLPEVVAYVAIAALALIVVAEIEAFTAVEMSRRFAVAFAVLTTMALQAVWTVAQFYADRWLDTAYLRSQAELQWDFVFVTVVAVVVGAVFERLGYVTATVDGRGRES